MKALICDLPYPTTDNLTKDIVAGKIIFNAYASLCGELNAILQYEAHAVHIADFSEQDATTLEEIAMAEMIHLDLLANTLHKLGLPTNYVTEPFTYNFFNTSNVSRATQPERILLDNIKDESDAIFSYRQMLTQLQNEQVSAIIERIIMDEQLHLSTLKEMYARYCK